MTNYQNSQQEIPSELLNYQQPVSANGTDIPCNLQAEENLLRLIIFGKGSILNVIEPKIDPAFFYSELNRKIYCLCLDLRAKGREISAYTIIGSFPAQREQELQLVKDQLASILEAAFAATTDYIYLIEQIADSYFRRKPLEVASQLKAMSKNPNIKGEDLINYLNQVSQSLTQLIVGQDSRSLYLEEVYPEIIKKASAGKTNKIKVGLQDIDLRIGGFVQDDLVIIAGQTSMGKTQVLTDLAYRHWQVLKKPVVFLTCELSAEQIAERFFFRDAAENGMNHIESRTFNLNSVATEDWGRLSKLCTVCGRIKIYEFDGDINLIPLIIAEIQSENNGEIGMVIVDYIQKLSLGATMQNNRNRELEIIADKLKRYAQQFKCPFLVSSQLSRNVSGRTDKRPLMSDIRDSGAIEQSADQVWLLYRDEYYDANSTAKGILEINFAKLRNGGETGTLQLLLDRAHSCIKPMTQQMNYRINSEGAAYFDPEDD